MAACIRRRHGLIASSCIFLILINTLLMQKIMQYDDATVSVAPWRLEKPLFSPVFQCVLEYQRLPSNGVVKGWRLSDDGRGVGSDVEHKSQRGVRSFWRGKVSEGNGIVHVQPRQKEHWKRILDMPSTGFHSFNATASDMISMHRAIWDTRPEKCKSIKYELSSLPIASVIIIFHNEARSTLLRTVQSVLNRTPAQLLHEIILIDDASTYPWLLDPLEDYITHWRKVRLIRIKVRQGLIRARLRGAEEATAEVVVFLDSHIEVNVQWLEPLLSRIKEDRTVLVVPFTDPISWQDLTYMRPDNLYHGAFRWDLVFLFQKYPGYRRRMRQSDIEAVATPTMVGCAHAIDRKYFIETGSYDPDMNIWGGENLEHSFRLWMCGGRIESLPCSRVGHIFKPRLPYSFGGENSRRVIQRNLIRTAEVWMDEYKSIYYATQNSLPSLDLRSLGIRKRLRTRLGCKSFEWYLKTIFPELPIPPRTSTYFGQLMSKSMANSKLCVQVNTRNMTLRTGECMPVDEDDIDDQRFNLDLDGRIYYTDWCIMAKDATLVLVKPCPLNTTTRWRYDQRHGTLQLELHKKCLTYDVNRLPSGLRFNLCVPGAKNQGWKFMYKFNFTKDLSIVDIPEKALDPPKGAIYFGQVRNAGSGRCLDVSEQYGLSMVSCDSQLSRKATFYLSRNGHFGTKELCFHAEMNVSCTGNTHISPINLCHCRDAVYRPWEYWSESRQVVVSDCGQCLTLGREGAIQLQRCEVRDANQHWSFSHQLLQGQWVTSA